MQARFKATIFRLKSTAKLRTIQRRQLKAIIKARDAKISRLEAENKRLKVITQPQPIFNYVYPAQIILLAVFMVVHAGASLRCAAATVEFYAKLMGWPPRKPSPASVRGWVLKCGYHSLTYARNLQGDYMAIIDESIQIGGEKLLLLLGVKLGPSGYTHSAALTTGDVEVLGMEVQPSWNGEMVAHFISHRLKSYPKLNLLYVVCDQGTTLLAALRRLHFTFVSDCSHVMMNAAKALFGQDAKLSGFCQRIGTIRRQLALTKWSFLLPPTLRDKDRFLRIFTLCKWVDRMDQYWDKLDSSGRVKISFYRRYGTLLNRLRQVRDLITITAGVLKKEGLSEQSHEKWEGLVNDYLATQAVITHKAKQFIKLMKNYFAQHAGLYKDGKQLACCSDIIESTFGRYKNKGGMKVISADVLGIALYNRELTMDFVTDSMLAVRLQAVEEWSKKNICHNRYSLLRKMHRELKSEE